MVDGILPALRTRKSKYVHKDMKSITNVSHLVVQFY